MARVEAGDPFRKIFKWWLFTFASQLMVFLIVWGTSAVILHYYRNFFAVLLFFAAFFLSVRLSYAIENQIGVQCSLQNPNRNNLVPLVWPWQRRSSPSPEMAAGHAGKPLRNPGNRRLKRLKKRIKNHHLK